MHEATEHTDTEGDDHDGRRPAAKILTGAQALVESLERVGVEVIFGIPGGAILPAYDPLYDSS